MALRNQRRTAKSAARAKTTTLQDVADVAGVTAMTVSRVVKNKGYVAPATRERVLRVAGELNYTANLSARALATGKTGVIAVISSSLNHFYYANIVSLLEAQITANGYQMRLLHNHTDMNNLLNSTNAAAVDGTIVTGVYQLVEEFRAQNPQIFSPCVFIDALEHSESDHIHCNFTPAVEAAVETMARAGRQRIAYVGHIGGLSSIDFPEERMRAYLGVMARLNRAPEIVGPPSHVALTRAMLRNYFAQKGCPDAIVCVNDETAIYVYRALRDANCRVPDDALLIGCDDLPFMECFDPPLSTIAQPTAEICALAWKFLQNRMKEPDIPLQQATFDAQLLVRASLQNSAN